MDNKGNWKQLLTVVLVLLAMLFSFVVGLRIGHERTEPAYKSDTIYTRHDSIVHDTTLIPYPVPVREKQLDDSVSVNLYEYEGSDTIVTDVKIPRTQVEYEDSTYHAWVSGIEPRLDSIHTYQRNIISTITRDITQTIYKKRRITHGIQGGLYLTPKGVQPGIGYGITISF